MTSPEVDGKLWRHEFIFAAQLKAQSNVIVERPRLKKFFKHPVDFIRKQAEYKKKMETDANNHGRLMQIRTILDEHILNSYVEVSPTSEDYNFYNSESAAGMLTRYDLDGRTMTIETEGGITVVPFGVPETRIGVDMVKRKVIVPIIDLVTTQPFSTNE